MNRYNKFRLLDGVQANNLILDHVYIEHDRFLENPWPFISRYARLLKLFNNNVEMYTTDSFKLTSSEFSNKNGKLWKNILADNFAVFIDNEQAPDDYDPEIDDIPIISLGDCEKCPDNKIDWNALGIILTFIL